MKRLAIVGLGHRAGRFLDEIAGHHRAAVSLVGFCDVSSVRMEAHNARLRELHGMAPVPTYSPDRFGEMLRLGGADTVLVATVDNTHEAYIVQGLEAGCRVVTEKPMAVDAGSCRRILAAAKGREDRLKIAFNYRWAPSNRTVRELISAGTIGPVRSVLLEWLLDIHHGADYFRRWHSDKSVSGGLLVHKATHHFDLVNWWTDSIPLSVYATGGLVFYGKENAVLRGEGPLTEYPRYTGEPRASADPFRIDLAANEWLRRIYLAAEGESGYIRDRNVFRDGITIEDNLSVTVRYRGDMVLTYVLNAFSSREGMRVVFNGDRGRIEYYLFAKSSGSRRESDEGFAEAGKAGGHLPTESVLVRVYPHFRPPYNAPVALGEGGHWGGDPPMIRHLFGEPPEPDRCNCSAGPEQGAASLLVGVAGNLSMAENRAVSVASLAGLNPGAVRLSELV